MNDTMVTLTGWVGGDVSSRQAGDTVVANFRVGSTPRRYSRKTGEWSDGETQWVTVSAWRTLGENCQRSLRRGDPVVVYGRQTVETYQRNDGTTATSHVVEAMFVGHDLNRGTSSFLRNPRAVPAPPPPVRPDTTEQPSGVSAA